MYKMFGYGSGSLRSDCSGYLDLHGSLPCYETAVFLGEGISEAEESMDDTSNSHYSEASDTGAMSITSSLSSLSFFPYTTRRRNSSASSNVSGSQKSIHCKEVTMYGLCDVVGHDLWKDNPEQDRFNTFSVSETELTNVIGYLENQIESHKTKNRVSESCESSDNVINSVHDDLGQPEGVPQKVTFILDTYCHIYMYRKADLRELKLLQKNENKQYQDLIYKAQMAREMQDKKFESDMQSLVKNYDQDMDTLTKQQKQQVEKAESSQAGDLKTTAKRIKLEQEKDYRLFRDKQKEDRKLMQREFDMLAKTAKKEDVRKRKEHKEIQLQEEERQFLESQQERMDKHMKQLTETHRQKIAMLESQFLQQKQQLLRAREAAIWEMEKQQLHEKHQLAKSQLKDMFFLKRHQMLTRHQKEVEQMKRSNQSKEEEMQHRHILEKKRLPKILKQESKTRSLMFKQSLRLSIAGNPEDERSKLKQFEENEKKRMKTEQQRQENKHKKQWEELVFRNESSLRELEQLQAEKRKMLMEHETQKIKELEEQYSNELRDWKAMLIPRKQRLEDEFAKQREEQEKFYGAVIMTGESTYGPGPRSIPNSLRHKPDSRHSTVPPVLAELLIERFICMKNYS
ncbi:SLK-like protein, partial [Mya arenaria]